VNFQFRFPFNSVELVREAVEKVRSEYEAEIRRYKSYTDRINVILCEVVFEMTYFRMKRENLKIK